MLKAYAETAWILATQRRWLHRSIQACSVQLQFHHTPLHFDLHHALFTFYVVCSINYCTEKHLHFSALVNAQRMRTMVTVPCILYQSPGFFSGLSIRTNLFFNKLSFGRYSTFHGYFVLSSPDKRFHILLVAIAVTCNVLYNAHP